MTGVNAVEIRKTREPDVDADGAILKVEACGICGTDARTFFNGDPKALVDQNGHLIKPPVELRGEGGDGASTAPGGVSN